MSAIAVACRVGLAALAARELGAALDRQDARRAAYAAALRRSREVGRPLLVVGSPAGGAWTRAFPSYPALPRDSARFARCTGLRDACLDLDGCRQEDGSILEGSVGDVQRMPHRTGSCVVFESCVLELVPDPWLAQRELLRVAGSPLDLYQVRVAPSTLTAGLYPASRWTWAPDGQAVPVAGARVGSAALIGLLAVGAVVG